VRTGLGWAGLGWQTSPAPVVGQVCPGLFHQLEGEKNKNKKAFSIELRSPQQSPFVPRQKKKKKKKKKDFRHERSKGRKPNEKKKKDVGGITDYQRKGRSEREFWIS